MTRIYRFLGYEDIHIPNYGNVTEAEYNGARPGIVFGDNQSAIAMSRNPVSHRASKHIETKWHWVRMAVREGRFKLVFVPTETNLADMLTKSLARKKFRYFMERLVHGKEKTQSKQVQKEKTQSKRVQKTQGTKARSTTRRRTLRRLTAAEGAQLAKELLEMGFQEQAERAQWWWMERPQPYRAEEA